MTLPEDRLVRVDAVREHYNAWGEREHKIAGDSYRLPRRHAEALIAQRLVVLHVRAPRQAPRPDRGRGQA
ncbi:MAG: hypothetical protein ACREX8_06680 [Gammaproteobacteria bacterium]